MEYRGNPSLPKEIKDRILTTFQQTLQSAREGNYQEAMLGCDFILRLDPDFKPAQQLTERLKQVAGKEVAGAGPEVPPPSPKPAAPPPPAAPPADLAPRMRSLLEARELKPLMELARKHRDAVLGNPEMRGLVEQAQSRLEADPYIQELVQSGRKMLENGQLDEVDTALAKGRELDPTHPQLRELEELRQAITAPQEERAGVDTGPIDLGTLEEDPLGALSDDPFSLGGEDGPDTDFGAFDDSFSLDGGDGPDAGPDADFGTADDPFSLDGGDGPDADFGTADDSFSLGETEMPEADGGPDFGAFDLEEEAPPAAEGGEPSFDLPDDPFALGDEEEAPAAAAGDPFASFEEAAGDAGAGFDPGGSAGGEDGDSRIVELLDEGQTQFEREDYQGAIDAWSRIFLIDIDHREATRRIEKARSLKAEKERQVEEIFYEGLEQLKGGQLDEAQNSLRKVLELQPAHTAAQEYLSQLEAGEVPELTGISAPRSGPASDTSTVPTPEEISGTAMPEIGEPEELKEEILVPPDPGDLPGGTRTAGGVAGDRPPTKDASQARRKFLLIGSGVLLLVLVAGGYAWLNRDRWFPNSDAPPSQGQPLQLPKNPVEEAQRLYNEGKTTQALNQLRLLDPNSPYHAEAQKLIAEWEAATRPKPSLSPEDAARREQLLAASAQYFAGGQMLAAQEALVAAGELAPLEGEAKERMTEVQQRLAPMQQEIALVREGEWDTARQRLRAMQLENPGNPDVARLLIICHYNQGVQALQRNSLEQAEAHFSAVLDLDPEDVESQRHFRFAQAYQQREKDMLFKTYVKYLPFR